MTYIIVLSRYYEDAEGDPHIKSKIIGAYNNITPKSLKEIWKTVSQKEELFLSAAKREGKHWYKEWHSLDSRIRNEKTGEMNPLPEFQIYQKKRNRIEWDSYYYHRIIIQKFDEATELLCEYNMESILEEEWENQKGE